MCNDLRYIVIVSFTVFLSTAAVTGCPGGCRRSIRQSYRARGKDERYTM